MVHALILALKRQRQMDLCEIKASLVYRSSRTAMDTQRNPILKKQLVETSFVFSEDIVLKLLINKFV